MANPEDALTKKIKTIYKQAGTDIRKKLKDFQEAHKERNKKMLAELAAGRITQDDYARWLSGQVFTGKRWQEKLDDISKAYVNADKESREIIGGTMRNTFVDFANKTAFDMEKGMHGAVSFDLYDSKTVERLLKGNPKMLPEWKIDEPKDYKWNEQRVRRAVTQGIIQGESVDDVCGRLVSELATSNARKMDMFARTAMNGAQNAGRIERLHEAQDMGIEVKKKWLATLDNRTRDTHQALDGQEQNVDDPFMVDGMKIDYPGDPTAPPELVYNCRCTLTYVYPKFRHLSDGERRDQQNGRNIENMTYYEWVGLKKREEKQAAQPVQQQQAKVVAEMTDFADINDYFKTEYNIDVKDGVTQLDVLQVRTAMGAIDDTIKQFPVLGKQITSIRTNTAGYMCSNGSYVAFNPRYWQKGDKRYYIEWNAYQAGAHEVGHCIDLILCRKEHSTMEGGMWGNAAGFVAKKDWDSNVVSRRIVQRAVSAIKKKVPEAKGMSAGELRRSISDYATTDTSETLAEAVGYVMVEKKFGLNKCTNKIGLQLANEIVNIITNDMEGIK